MMTHAGAKKDDNEEMTTTTACAPTDGQSASVRIASGIQEVDVTVNEPDGITEFSGRMIAQVSTRTGRQARWTELTLYWHRDEGYVVVKAGLSAVYHAHGGSCNSGVPITVGDLYDKLPEHEFDNLLQCHVCKPLVLSRLDDDDLVSAETTRAGVIVCTNAQDLLNQLRWQQPGTQQVSDNGLSAPAERLLRIASEKDPEIRSVIRRVRKL